MGRTWARSGVQKLTGQAQFPTSTVAKGNMAPCRKGSGRRRNALRPLSVQLSATLIDHRFLTFDLDVGFETEGGWDNSLGDGLSHGGGRVRANCTVTWWAFRPGSGGNVPGGQMKRETPRRLPPTRGERSKPRW